MVSKKELYQKLGKKSFLSDLIRVSAAIEYISGIPYFDKLLNGKSLKQINAVIQIEKYPKGILIRVAKLFSSYSYGISYNEIRNIEITNSLEPTIIFHLKNNETINFLIVRNRISELIEFLDKTHLKYETKIVAEISNEKTTMTKKDLNQIYNLRKRKK